MRGGYVTGRGLSYAMRTEHPLHQKGTMSSCPYRPSLPAAATGSSGWLLPGLDVEAGASFTHALSIADQSCPAVGTAEWTTGTGQDGRWYIFQSCLAGVEIAPPRWDAAMADEVLCGDGNPAHLSQS